MQEEEGRNTGGGGKGRAWAGGGGRTSVQQGKMEGYSTRTPYLYEYLL